jgi:hypothetical protein
LIFTVAFSVPFHSVVSLQPLACGSKTRRPHICQRAYFFTKTSQHILVTKYLLCKIVLARIASFPVASDFFIFLSGNDWRAHIFWVHCYPLLDRSQVTLLGTT